MRIPPPHEKTMIEQTDGAHDAIVAATQQFAQVDYRWPFCFLHSAHRRLAASAMRRRPSADILRLRRLRGRADSVAGAVGDDAQLRVLRDSSGKAFRIA